MYFSNKYSYSNWFLIVWKLFMYIYSIQCSISPMLRANEQYFRHSNMAIKVWRISLRATLRWIIQWTHLKLTTTKIPIWYQIAHHLSIAGFTIISTQCSIARHARWPSGMYKDRDLDTIYLNIIAVDAMCKTNRSLYSTGNFYEIFQWLVKLYHIHISTIKFVMFIAQLLLQIISRRWALVHIMDGWLHHWLFLLLLHKL